MTSTPFTIPLATAERCARVVTDLLREHCRQIHVAGSIRRRHPHVKDIDLVIVPKPAPSLYADTSEWWSEGFCNAVNGSPRWTCESACRPDSRHVRVRSVREHRLAIELWLATPHRVGAVLTIRTGPSDFARDLVTAARDGAVPAGPGYRFEHGWLTYEGRIVHTPREEDVFTELGLPCIPAAERSPETLRAHLTKNTVPHSE